MIELLSLVYKSFKGMDDLFCREGKVKNWPCSNLMYGCYPTTVLSSNNRLFSQAILFLPHVQVHYISSCSSCLHILWIEIHIWLLWLLSGSNILAMRIFYSATDFFLSPSAQRSSVKETTFDITLVAAMVNSNHPVKHIIKILVLWGHEVL